MTMEQASSVEAMGLELVEPLNESDGWRRVMGSIPGPRTTDPAARGPPEISVDGLSKFRGSEIRSQRFLFRISVEARIRGFPSRRTGSHLRVSYGALLTRSGSSRAMTTGSRSYGLGSL